ncbi:cytochrome c oxidase assembly protein [Brachybacterium alimentarium]|uniref:cytochrome c oxidase assembly protein n=1 Tax=Brachybacterium alimentarium TaxID=47845 RepID=UPI003FD13961
MSANLLLGASVFEDIHKGFPGTGTAVTAAALRGAADLAAVVSLGAVVSVLFLHPRTPRRADQLRFTPDMSVLTWASGAWVVLAAANVVVSAPESNGLPLSRLAELGAFGPLYTFGYMPRAWTVTTAGALVLWLCTYWGTRWTTLLPGLWAGVVGALAPAVVGQVLVGPNHDVGSDAGTIQLLAAGLLLGPVIIAAGIRWIPRRSSQKAPLNTDLLVRAGLLGAWIVLAMELVLMWFMLAGTAPWDSVTGTLFLIRLALLAALVTTLTSARRRNTHRTLEAALLIVLWLAVGSAMTRIPPPQYFVPTSIQQVFMGFEVTDPPSLGILVWDWRVNLLFAALAATGIIAYMAMMIILRRRGEHWPFGRALAWCTGWLVVLVATNSGLGRYSAPDLGIHMAVHMSLSMLTPILLAHGGIVTLVLRTARTDRRRAGVHTWVRQILDWQALRILCHPAVVFVVFIGSYYALYFTSLFELMMRVHWAHQLMNLHFLVTGYAFYSLLIGLDRPPLPLPHIGKLGYALAAMPLHAFFAVAITSSDALIAGTYYQYLELPWADLWETQEAAGAVALIGGEIPMLIAIIALVIQWARQDSAETRRGNRPLDRGLDTEFDAYNDMLEKLSDRERTS